MINKHNTIRNLKFSLPKLAMIIFLLANGSDLLANTRLPAIFSDGMVLQQNTDILIWGWADPGESIKVTTRWSKQIATTKANSDGKWQLKIKTTKAGGPYSIIIEGKNKIELKDVLLGEVWLCSGQSNMAFTLKSSEGGKEEVAKADYPSIRYFSVKRQYGLNDFDDCPGSNWEKTSPVNAGSYSAVAFYFAKKIQQELKVPVGLIYTAWGGTPAEAWTPRRVTESDSILSKYITRWADIQNNVGADSVVYHERLVQWEKDSANNKKPAEPQTLYYFKRPWREPSVLFNGMIQPVSPFSIKGVLWYQGESNVNYADEYFRLFSKMIVSWRSEWKSKNLPFYFVQIAPYGYNDLNNAALLREAQQHVADQIPNTAMAVTMDLGNMDDIHFTRKREIGDRLANTALYQLYKQNKFAHKATEVKQATLKDGHVIIEFNGGELDDTKMPQGIEIGYRSPEGKLLYVKAKAKIEGKKIITWTEETISPIEVRYGWVLAGEANLSDIKGIPIAPFRITIKK